MLWVGSGRVGSGRVGSGRVGSGHYVLNIMGRDGSGQEPLNFRGSCVASRGVEISRVGSGRVERFGNLAGRVGSGRVESRRGEISRV